MSKDKGFTARLVTSIEISIHQLPNTMEYTEFFPDFTEQNLVIPYEQEQKLIEQAEKDYKEKNQTIFD